MPWDKKEDLDTYYRLLGIAQILRGDFSVPHKATREALVTWLNTVTDPKGIQEAILNKLYPTLPREKAVEFNGTWFGKELHKRRVALDV